MRNRPQKKKKKKEKKEENDDLCVLFPTIALPHLVSTFRKMMIFAVISDDYPPLLGEHIS